MKYKESIFRLLWTAACLLAGLFGLWSQVWSGGPEPTDRIFGDKGDGLFNVWVLEHVYRSVALGVGELADGRIFQPFHDQTYWWSDNLLVPGAGYSLFRWAALDPFASAFWTGMLFAGAVFAASVGLMLELFRAVRPERKAAAWAVPLLAYAAAFSEARLVSYNHYQNFAAVFLVLLAWSAARQLRLRRRRDLALMAFWELCLLFSSPYHALLGVVLLAAWAFCQSADPEFRPVRFLRRNLPPVLPFAPPALWIAWRYAQVDPLAYPLSEVHKLSLRIGNLTISRFSGKWPEADLYPGGYLGLGLIIALMVIPVLLIVRHWRAVTAFARRRGVWIWLTLLLVSLIDAKEIKPVTVWLRLGVGLAVPVWIWIRCRRAGLSAADRTLLFVAGSASLVYALAFGPVMLFEGQALDPGVFGWFRHLVPGFGSMRELIRFAPTGQVLLIATGWLLWLKALRTRRAAAYAVLAMGCLGLQLADSRTVRPILTPVGPGERLRPEEIAFFRGVRSPMLVLPTVPVHRAARYMVLWQPVDGLDLVNGYSGRIAPEYDRFLELERLDGRASDSQLAHARNLGVKGLCLDKAVIPLARQAELRRAYPVEFENDRWLVLRLGTPPGSAVPADEGG